MLIGALGVIMLVMIIWGLTTFTTSGWRFFLSYALILLSIVFLSFLVLNTISYVVLALIDPYQAIKGAETTHAFLLISYVLKALLMINTISLINRSKNLYQGY
jgi:putative ABC transport system permease protein